MRISTWKNHYFCLAQMVAATLALLCQGQLTPPTTTQKSTTAPFEINNDQNLVVAHNEAGGILWTRKLDGYLGLVRPPHLLYDADRVYVTHTDGVTALDTHTGNVLWHSKGPADRMLLSGDLLLAALCTSDDYVPKEGKLLLARSAKDGKEVFHLQLPLKDFDPLPIEERADLFLVQDWDDPGGKGNALLVDKKGQLWHQFDRQIVDAIQVGDNRIFETSKDIVSLSAKGNILWTAKFSSQEWIAGGGILELPDKSLLAHIYCHISDNGVQLIRLSPKDGRIFWQTRCVGLGVAHSIYSQDVTVTLVDQSITVKSVASGGTFTESLDLASGKQLKRD